MALPRETVLPSLDGAELERMRGQFGPSWLGPTRALPQPVEGEWSWTQEGSRVWRAAIRSMDARALRIRFERFGAEGQVWLYGDDQGIRFVGPYAGSGPHGDGRFWSGFVFGEVVTIEYVPHDPVNAPPSVPFLITSVGHVASEAFPVPHRAGKPAVRFERQSIAGCRVDVSCYPYLEKRQQPAVARLYTQDDDGGSTCTGFLINPRYKTGDYLLMLTAGHCIESDEEARDTSFLWNYQTETCYGNTDWEEWSTPLAYSYGSALAVSMKNDEHDFALLALRRSDVEAVTGWTSYGWSTRDVADGEQVASVGHPDGSFKRVSVGHVDDAYWWNKDFRAIDWHLGTSEPGSSGSAVLSYYDPGGYWAVVGVLFGSSVDQDEEDNSQWGAYCAGDVRAAFDPLRNFYDRIRVYMESEAAVLRIGNDDHANVAAHATLIELRESVEGRIEVGSDIDYFRIEVPDRIVNVEIFTWRSSRPENSTRSVSWRTGPVKGSQRTTMAGAG